MAHTYTKLLYHVLFGTQDRVNTLTADLRPRLFPYIGGIMRNLGGSAVSIGGVSDHIHLGLHLPPRLALSDVVRDLKANSSKWINEQLGMKGKFAWQGGFTAFTVSQSRMQAVLDYINSQEDHHAKQDFKAELKRLLEKHNVPFDVDALV